RHRIDLGESQAHLHHEFEARIVDPRKGRLERCGVVKIGHQRSSSKPPSTKRLAAVMKEASSDARNSTALATSSASPMRCIGILAIIISLSLATSSSLIPGLR